MPFLQRYSDVKKGGIVFTGNTPGLSKAHNQTVTVAFMVTANSLPAVNPVFNIARADYEFFPFAGSRSPTLQSARL